MANIIVNQASPKRLRSQATLTAGQSYLVLTGILLLAGMVRFLNLGVWSYWIEEYHTVRHTNAVDSFSVAALLDTRGAYYLGTQLMFDLLGESPFAARLLPALFGLMTVLLVFWLAQRTLGSAVALLAASLMALSPWHLFWSQNARFYTLVALLSLVSLAAFYWALEKDNLWLLIISIGTIGFASLLQFACALLYPIFLVYMLLLYLLRWSRPPGIRLRTIGLFAVVPVIGFIAYEMYGLASQQATLTSKLYYLFFNPSTRSFIGYSGAYVMLSSALSFIGVLLGVMSLVGAFYFYIEKNRLGLLLTLGAYVPLLAFMALTYIASTAVRYIFFSLPFWIVLAAYGVQRLVDTAQHSTPLRWALIGAGALIATGLIVWKDPVVEDALHYLYRETALQALLIGGVALFVLAAIGILWVTPGRTAKAGMLLGFTIVFALLFQSLVSGFLYYGYQHGYRDNWNAMAQTLAQDAGETDVILGGAPPFAEFQLQREVMYVVDAMADPATAAPQASVWLIEDKDAHSVAGAELPLWIAEHCVQQAEWDTFTYGIDWPMRLHRCTLQ